MKKLDFLQTHGIILFASEMIKDLKIASIEINTNNPEKVNQLKKKGIKVNKIIPSVMPTNDHNQNYLKTKKREIQSLSLDTVLALFCETKKYYAKR